VVVCEAKRTELKLMFISFMQIFRESHRARYHNFAVPITRSYIA
jgi:hypothetical protein